MKKATTEPTRTLVPVHGAHGCVGFLLRTARGFRAFNIADQEIGVFDRAELGGAALLELATETTGD